MVVAAVVGDDVAYVWLVLGGAGGCSFASEDADDVSLETAVVEGVVWSPWSLVTLEDALVDFHAEKIFYINRNRIS